MMSESDNALLNKYTELSRRMSSNDNRESIPIKTFTETCKDILHIVTLCKDLSHIVTVTTSDDSTSSSDGKMASTVLALLRFLRNSCVQCSRNQDAILDAGILQPVEKLAWRLLHPTDKEVASLPDLQLAMVQFLGNLIVQNQRAQQALWGLAFPKLFFSLLSNLRELSAKEAVCMIVYNCLAEETRLLHSEDGRWLVVAVMQHCGSYADAEWGWFLLESLVESRDFPLLYDHLADQSELRCLLVDLLQSQLEDQPETRLTSPVSSSSAAQTDIPACNLAHVSRDFQTRSQCMSLLSTTDEEQLHLECFLITRILGLLCVVTSDVSAKYDVIRRDQGLLKSVTALLKQASHTDHAGFFSKPCDPTAGRIPDYLRSSKTNSQANNPDNSIENSVHGFKRNLIRLIGNMCYEARDMQDMVRDEDCILPILNACNIDDINPYITQWAVFAIRNLCQQNGDNQQVIAELERQGLASNGFLSRTDVRVELEGGRLRLGQK